MMAGRFLDRVQQRAEFAAFLRNDEIKVLQVSGEPSSGKSEFVRYAASKIAEQSFEWTTGLVVHRCFQSDRSRPLGLITDMLASICKKHPSQTVDFLCSLDKQSLARSATYMVLDIAKDFVPFSSMLPHLQAAMKRPMRNNMVNNVVGEISERQSLLSYVEGLFDRISEQIDFIIVDDLDEADIESIRILFTLLSRSGKGKVRLVFSDSGSNREFADIFKDFYWYDHQMVVMHRLNAEECLKVCREYNENISDRLVHVIHDRTEGNFGKLAEILPHSEDEFRQFLKDATGDSDHQDIPELSLDVEFASSEWQQLRPLLALQVFLSGEVPIELLSYIPQLSMELSNWLEDPDSLVQKAIVQPVGRDRITLVQGTLVFSHIFQEQIRQNFGLRGDLRKIGTELAASILEDNRDHLFQNEASFALIGFLYQFHPEPLLQIIEETCDRGELGQVSYDAILRLSQLSERCFEQDWPRFRQYLIELFDYCYKRSLFVAAAQLLPLHCAPSLPFALVLKVADCAREIGSLRQMETADFDQFAQDLHDQARSLQDRICLANTLCPIYEHRGDYEQIRTQYRLIDDALATQDPKPDQATNVQLIRFQLNRGLSAFHGDILDQLKDLGHPISQIRDLEEKRVLEAIHHNHLGLGYFYTGRYDEAIKHFGECFLITKALGRRMETPTNNLATSYLMKGELERAKDTFAIALRMPLIPLYQKFTILLNASLTAFELGMHERAISMMAPYVSGAISLPDPSLDNKFAVNRAYMHFRREEWAEANRLYMQAVQADYRFCGDSLRRTYEHMARFCAVKAGYLSSTDLGDMDFLFRNIHQGTVFEKPFITDVNSLYIF